jgi:quinol monooxygenase YgiN
VSKIAVVAKIPAAPGKRDELAAAMQVALDNVASEEGTLVYVLHADSKDADTLWMYELYTDQEALDAHGRAPWFKELGPRLAPLLGGRLEVHVMSLVGGKGL